MNDTATDKTLASDLANPPAKLSGFSTAKTQQAGSLVTLARCDWAALHNGDNSLPNNPAQIASFMQHHAAQGVAVVTWLQGPAVIINGHDSKAATVALLAVVNAYRSALAAAEAAEAEALAEALARQAAAEAGEAAAEAAAEAARQAEAPSKRNGRNGRGR